MSYIFKKIRYIDSRCGFLLGFFFKLGCIDFEKFIILYLSKIVDFFYCCKDSIVKF